MRIKNTLIKLTGIGLVGVTEQTFIFHYIGCFHLESLSLLDCKLHEEKPFC